LAFQKDVIMNGRVIWIFVGTLFVVDAAAGAEGNHSGFAASSPITNSVKAKLGEDKAFASIEVDTDKQGEVWLSGTVDSKDLAERAVDEAKNTKGVKAVHDYIEVRKTP
jgi:hyperosmotically inducible protein